MKYTLFALSTLLLFLLWGCIPEDRSGEQPFAPTVVTLGATPQANSVVVEGEIQLSPNSLITGCGFTWGNDTLRRQELIAGDIENYFSTVIEDLEPGDYFVAAFATNGVGTSYGDTLVFTIDN
ncbi:MAG: hypothetical protein IJ553_00525 [Alloprevotella sp.]|nr:hypothetical protein [Alloprevotella sp.]